MTLKLKNEKIVTSSCFVTEETFKGLFIHF